MAYCTEEAVRELLPGVDLAVLGDAAAQTAALSAMIEAAGCEVDARCRRTFAPPTEPATRFFDGSGTHLLRVPDMVRLDRIAVEGATVSPACAYPSDGPPFRWVATGARFAIGYQNIAVTGLWGFADEVPSDIARATAALAAAEVLERLQAERSGGVTSQQAGQMREAFPDGGPYADRLAGLQQTAARLLLPYRRWVV